jgi:hypothetical protein
VTGEPAHVAFGPVMTGVGAALIGTVVLEVALQPPLATVTLMPTLPDAPAVKVMACVPAPLVMEPFVTVHVYVAPVWSGTLALPGPEAQTEAGAVIVADGAVLIGTFALELLEQPFTEMTVMPRVTLPEAAGEKLMAFVPEPPVIVPLVIDQL